MLLKSKKYLKVKNGYFSIKVKVKDIRSLTLMSVERVALDEYACSI